MTKVTNHRLEFDREEKRKNEKMIEKRKIEAIATKHCRNKREISLSSEKEESYESDTGDDTNPNQADDKYLLQHLVSLRQNPV